jgi:pantetheine-phosphate adenylyltransferase
MRAMKPRRLGVYAGSFDPATVGHLWMIEQGVLLFDRLVVAIGTNLEKRYTFSVEERLAMLRDSLKSFRNVSLMSFSDRYLIDFAQSLGATHVLRGIRSESDYEYERTMRNINGDLDRAICTVFLMPPRDIAEVSSSMVKNLVGPQGWQQVVRKYVPNAVYKRLLAFAGTAKENTLA